MHGGAAQVDGHPVVQGGAALVAEHPGKEDWLRWTDILSKEEQLSLTDSLEKLWWVDIRGTRHPYAAGRNGTRLLAVLCCVLSQNEKEKARISELKRHLVIKWAPSCASSGLAATGEPPSDPINRLLHNSLLASGVLRAGDSVRSHAQRPRQRQRSGCGEE